MSEISLEKFGNDYSARVSNALEQLKLGKGVLLLDAANRENEGDLIYAAENMSFSDMALMIRECSGIVCLCLTPEKSESLGLRMMVDNNTSKNRTAFTISIEAKQGVITVYRLPIEFKLYEQLLLPMPNLKFHLLATVFHIPCFMPAICASTRRLANHEANAGPAVQ